MSESQPVPCARYAGLSAAVFAHPEGVCACFHGGPSPVLLNIPRQFHPPFAERRKSPR